MSSLKSKTPRGFERVPKKPDQHRFILFNFQVAILQKYKIYLSWDQFSPSSETEAARRFLECDLCQSNARKSCKYSYPQNQRLDFCQEEEKKWCVCVFGYMQHWCLLRRTKCFLRNIIRIIYEYEMIMNPIMQVS